MPGRAPCRFRIPSRLLASLVAAAGLLAATSARADLVRYAWSGFVEARPGSGNPWALLGDGVSTTQTDGTPFTVVALVEATATDLDGVQNPNYASFAPTSATLTIGGHEALLVNPRMTFANDNFSGLFDAASFQATATLFGTALGFSADVRLAPATFSLASPAALDLPPRFANTSPIQFGGSAAAALTTFPANATVSAQLEICAGPPAVAWSAPGTGTAGGIAVTVAGLATPGLDVFSLRGAAFAAGEQCSNLESLTYAAGSDWQVTLTPATNALLVYARFWRGPGAGAATTAYQFDAPFTILSGLTGATVSNGNTRLTLPSTAFHDGILRFQGPIAHLAVDVDSTTNAEQAMTFAVVPEPGLAAGLALGVAALGAVGGRAERARLRQARPHAE